ncbi:MAG: DegV family EDD domain-containing protein [Anaerolineae bacterium]|nr:DegV family EDD domain-containing protein [Anaerolineae bacterium]
MNSVRIITDSAAELTPEEAEELQVAVLPLRYSVGNTIYKQDRDISTERLMEILAQGNAKVTPLPPSTDDVTALLEAVTRAGQVALFVHVANGLVPVAEPIQEVSRGLFGRARIEIIDSMSVSYGLKRIVQTVALAAAQEAQLPEVTQLVRSLMSRVYTLFYSEDFESLEQSVDIQPAQAILAGILGVRPLVVLEEGRLLPLEKVTPRTTPVEKLTDFVLEFATVSELAILVGPSPLPLDVEELRERIMQSCPGLEVPVVPYGPLVAALVGTAAVGLFVSEGLQGGW